MIIIFSSFFLSWTHFISCYVFFFFFWFIYVLWFCISQWRCFFISLKAFLKRKLYRHNLLQSIFNFISLHVFGGIIFTIRNSLINIVLFLTVVFLWTWSVFFLFLLNSWTGFLVKEVILPVLPSTMKFLLSMVVLVQGSEGEVAVSFLFSSCFPLSLHSLISKGYWHFSIYLVLPQKHMRLPLVVQHTFTPFSCNWCFELPNPNLYSIFCQCWMLTS